MSLRLAWHFPISFWLIAWWTVVWCDKIDSNSNVGWTFLKLQNISQVWQRHRELGDLSCKQSMILYAVCNDRLTDTCESLTKSWQNSKWSWKQIVLGSQKSLKKVSALLTSMYY